MKDAIVVVCDSREATVSNGIITKAVKLAQEAKKAVFCVVIGKMESFYYDFFEYGCRGIIHCDYNEELNYYTLAEILKQMIEEYSPYLLMIPAMGIYKGAAAVIATALNAGLTADCIDIEYNKKYRCVFRRSALNSSIEARIVAMNEGTQLCTVKPTAFVAKKNVCINENDYYVLHKKYEVMDISNDFLEVLDLHEYEMNSNEFNNSDVILGMGRGIMESDVEIIEKIAQYFNASVGGTRIMVDSGILPKEQQIGQSGTSISPKLYIALGISGANQHVVGIKNAKKIIAFNLDEKAMIFNYSDYGAICDTHLVIQNLYERIKDKL